MVINKEAIIIVMVVHLFCQIISCQQDQTILLFWVWWTLCHHLVTNGNLILQLLMLMFNGKTMDFLTKQMYTASMWFHFRQHWLYQLGIVLVLLLLLRFWCVLLLREQQHSHIFLLHILQQWRWMQGKSTTIRCWVQVLIKISWQILSIIHHHSNSWANPGKHHSACELGLNFSILLIAVKAIPKKIRISLPSDAQIEQNKVVKILLLLTNYAWIDILRAVWELVARHIIQRFGVWINIPFLSKLCLVLWFSIQFDLYGYAMQRSTKEWFSFQG